MFSVKVAICPHSCEQLNLGQNDLLFEVVESGDRFKINDHELSQVQWNPSN